MALTASFSVGQSPSEPGILNFTDTSSGSDNTLTERRIFVQNAKGQYLVPEGVNTDYIVWDISQPNISVDVLVDSTAAAVKVQWVNGANTVVYEEEDTFVFDLFSRNFAYSLIAGHTPPVTLETTYSKSLAELWTDIIGAENAIAFASDVVASQACLDRAIYKRVYQNRFF